MLPLFVCVFCFDSYVLWWNVGRCCLLLVSWCSIRGIGTCVGIYYMGTWTVLGHAMIWSQSGQKASGIKVSRRSPSADTVAAATEGQGTCDGDVRVLESLAMRGIS